MGYEEYTWLRYYEDLCHRQKKINNNLAVKLGEIESKSAELDFALNRLTGSSFWKALAPARKIYGRIKGVNTGNSGAGCSTVNGSSGTINRKTEDDSSASENGMDEHTREYARRLAMYEDYYGQWIRTDETEQKYAAAGSDKNRDRVKNWSDLNGEKYRVILFDEIRSGINVDNSKNAEWLIFADKNTIPATGFTERLNDALAGKKDVLFAYTDEDYLCYESITRGISETGRIFPNFKPDWSPDTLDSFMYTGHMVILRTSVLEKITVPEYDDPYMNIYDMLFQVSDLIDKKYDSPLVAHISQILVHNIIDSETYDAAVRADAFAADYIPDTTEISSGVSEVLGLSCMGSGFEFNDIKINAFKRRKVNGVKMLTGQFPDQHHILYEVAKDTKVSVLIPSKDHPDVLKTCLDSFLEKTDPMALEFIVIDNGSSDDNRRIYAEYLEKLNNNSEYSFRYIYSPMPFNFSKMCNMAAAEATGRLLLFMNDDIEIIQKDWLKLMAGYAMLSHAGAVGAKLLYAGTDLIQHVGITNLEIGPSHKLVIYPDNRSYYYGKNTMACDVSGVTAACLMIDSIKFKLAGGFNEDFAVAYNDVDFCMKVAESGFTNIQCNGAVLYHHESVTRGKDADDDAKWDRLLHEKDRLYSLHPEFRSYDPYYNVNLTGNHSNYYSKHDFGYNNHLKTANVRQISAGKLAKIPQGNFRISLDSAGIQMKENLGEPEIIEVRGWIFESGTDNYDLTANVFLKRSDSGTQKRTSDIQDTILILKTEVYPRKDLADVFENERNIKLCGFSTKILKEDLPEGTYVVGLEPVRINPDLTGTAAAGEECCMHSVIFTDTVLTV